jgi:hypothetical protein
MTLHDRRPNEEDTMRRRIPTIMVALVAIELLFAFGCDKKEKKPPVQKKEVKDTFIPYTVLRQ